MQKLLLIIFAAASLLIGAFAFQQWRTADDLSKKVAALEQKLQKKEAADSEKEQAIAALKAKSDALQEESAHLREKIASATPSPTPESNPTAAPSPGGAKNAMKSMIDKMMKDPKMKKAIVAQQMMFMKPIFAGLLKSLHLSGADEAKFYDLLMDRSMKMMDAGVSAMNGGSVKPGEYDQEMKDFLGESGFAQFQSYEKSVPDRMAINQLNQQMGSTPLQGWQSDGLLQIMQQEKADPSKAIAGAGGDPGSLSDDQITAYMQATADRNARILTRSRTLLSPEQQKALENSQKQTLQMMEMGMKMGRDMMGK